MDINNCQHINCPNAKQDLRDFKKAQADTAM